VNEIEITRRYLPPITYRNHIITLNPSNLSTLIQRKGGTNTSTETIWSVRPFNFADLQQPVPASAYFANEKPLALFNGDFHGTIVEGNYWPTIYLPLEITRIAPELFASCRIKLSDESTFEWTVTIGDNTTTMVRLSRRGMWDPPVKLQPIDETFLTAPNIITKNFPATSSVAAGETPPLLHTPVLTTVTSYNTKVPGGPAVEEDKKGAASTVNAAPIATTVISMTTLKDLPAAIITQMGTRTVQARGPPLTLGDIIISRALNGDYIIKSSQLSYFYPKTVKKPGQTIVDNNLNGGPNVQTSQAERTVRIYPFLRWISVVSLLGSFYI
jgi:hypothetical protein